ncbi:hypothetical protein ACSX1A_07555 [Pontibacter sp. MBLB2868]|uniref:hypothetical protein n=1 Tax=Pontibacter sp. MBLB2868 TaxID=3451555 RepID=UPI003F74EA43
MLAFIVPIKPRFNSKNWDNDNRLLDRTLRSICNQTNLQFKVYVVYNDKPSIDYTHQNIEFVYFPFAYVYASNVEDYDSYASKWYSEKYTEYMFDKGKKITYGCKIAKEKGCSYIMAIDSDDLISNRIAEFISTSQTKSYGWVVRKGYMFVEESLYVLKSKAIQNYNGSTHIIRQDLVHIPDFNQNKLWEFNFFEAHGYLEQRMIDYYSIKLDTFPYYGTIWLIHKNNTSDAFRFLKPDSFKTIFKYILRGKRLTKALRDEFSLY